MTAALTIANPLTKLPTILSNTLFVSLWMASCGSAQTPNDTSKRFETTVRASDIDSRVKAYPEIGFLIEDAKGKPADQQQAWFDPAPKSRGKLVIWLMSHKPELFERLTGYGLHAMRIHYANRWFSICCQENPVAPDCRGNLRLEAATGEDFSDQVAIARPDGMAERAFQFVRHLANTNAPGNWGQFLNDDQTDLNWEKVIVSGSSHGSTTASRFAKHQKVARVVALCGPRDQHQNWQSLPSATPQNRFFGFSHVLDTGWRDDHYCRSWEMLGLHKFGPIVNVDQTKPPYENTRRLITDFDVKGDTKRAHSSVQPGKAAAKVPGTQRYAHEAVWKYLYTHDVNQIGSPVDQDPNCDHAQQQ